MKQPLGRFSLVRIHGEIAARGHGSPIAHSVGTELAGGGYAVLQGAGCTPHPICRGALTSPASISRSIPLGSLMGPNDLVAPLMLGALFTCLSFRPTLLISAPCPTKRTAWSNVNNLDICIWQQQVRQGNRNRGKCKRRQAMPGSHRRYAGAAPPSEISSVMRAITTTGTSYEDRWNPLSLHLVERRCRGS
jgi:hypothetical protein